MAQLLRCRAQDLLPMQSATFALNTVVRSWQRRFKPGPKQRMLVGPAAYGSTKRMLRSVSEETGCPLDEAGPLHFPLEGEDAVLSALEAALRPETALVVLDAIPSNAPFVLPLEEAVALCRRLAPEAFVVVDGAHGLFSLPLNLGKSPADAFYMNCHKWFCGPKGTALLHVRPEHQSWIEPLVISHGFGTDFVSGFYWQGLGDFSSWLALDATLAFWDLADLDAARLYGQYLVQDAAERLAEAWGTELGFPVELLGPMALVELPTLPMLGGAQDAQGCAYEHAEAVQNALFARRIEVPIKALSGRLYARISSHIYNYPEEYEVLRDAVLDLTTTGSSA